MRNVSGCVEAGVKLISSLFTRKKMHENPLRSSPRSRKKGQKNLYFFGNRYQVATPTVVSRFTITRLLLSHRCMDQGRDDRYFAILPAPQILLRGISLASLELGKKSKWRMPRQSQQRGDQARRRRAIYSRPLHFCSNDSARLHFACFVSDIPRLVS
jgi:hypothetical protein